MLTGLGPQPNKGSVLFNRALSLVKQQLRNKPTSEKNTLSLFFLKRQTFAISITRVKLSTRVKRHLPSVSTAVSIGIPRHVVARTYKLKKINYLRNGLTSDKYRTLGRIDEMPVKKKRGPVYMARVYLPVYPSARRKLSLAMATILPKVHIYYSLLLSLYCQLVYF